MTINSQIFLSLSKIPNLRALVVGDVMLDTYEFCYTSKSKPINSEKPGNIVTDTYRTPATIISTKGARRG